MASSNTPNLECRMYEERNPEKETPVVVCVTHVAKMGASVTLPEYNNAKAVLIDLEGISVLNNAIEACKEEIEPHNGKVVEKEAPGTVSEYEDQKLLADHMAKSGSNNVEVGDDNLEEGSDTGMGDGELDGINTSITARG